MTDDDKKPKKNRWDLVGQVLFYGLLLPMFTIALCHMVTDMMPIGAITVERTTTTNESNCIGDCYVLVGESYCRTITLWDMLRGIDHHYVAVHSNGTFISLEDECVRSDTRCSVKWLSMCGV